MLCGPRLRRLRPKLCSTSALASERRARTARCLSSHPAGISLAFKSRSQASCKIASILLVAAPFRAPATKNINMYACRLGGNIPPTPTASPASAYFVEVGEGALALLAGNRIVVKPGTCAGHRLLSDPPPLFCVRRLARGAHAVHVLFLDRARCYLRHAAQPTNGDTGAPYIAQLSAATCKQGRPPGRSDGRQSTRGRKLKDTHEGASRRRLGDPRTTGCGTGRPDFTAGVRHLK